MDKSDHFEIIQIEKRKMWNCEIVCGKTANGNLKSEIWINIAAN